MYPIHLTKQRDRYESTINAAFEQERIYKEKVGYAKEETKNLLQKYKEWLKTNKIEGYNYKF